MSDDSVSAIDIHVGKMLRALRKSRNVSQHTLAKSIGVTFQQVQKYEHGANRISASKMFAAAGVLGVAPAAFFEGLPGISQTLLPPEMTDFLSEDGAFEVAEGYLKLSVSQRSAVRSVIKAMLETA